MTTRELPRHQEGWAGAQACIAAAQWSWGCSGRHTRLRPEGSGWWGSPSCVHSASPQRTVSLSILSSENCLSVHSGRGPPGQSPAAGRAPPWACSLAVLEPGSVGRSRMAGSEGRCSWWETESRDSGLGRVLSPCGPRCCRCLPGPGGAPRERPVSCSLGPSAPEAWLAQASSPRPFRDRRPSRG